jgi:LysR family transcriptional regulator, cyn operon transcriptional activator
MYLIASKKHPLAGRKRVRMPELHRQKLVLSNKDSATRQMIGNRFQSVGAEPIVVAEMNSVAGMLSLIRRTKVGAIVSRLAVADTNDLKIIQLDSPRPLRTPGLLWKGIRPQSAAIRNFTWWPTQKMRPPK